MNKLSAMVLTLVFTGALYWVYRVELSTRWAYAGFEGQHTVLGLFIALIMSTALSLLIPTAKTSRALILALIHFAFYVPSIVFLVFNGSSYFHYFSLLILIASITFFSSFRYKFLLIPRLALVDLMWAIVGFNVLGILLYIAFGGLSNFNLNLEKVYSFRSLASDNLPGIFSYIYSNFSNVLIPALIVLGVTFRRWLFVIVGLVCATILFGMTHHKSVLFTPFAVIILYFFFQKITSPSGVGLPLLFALLLAVFEILYISEILQLDFTAIYTSYYVRRTLMVPPMLDSNWIIFFNDFPKYYWANSKFGLGIAQAPASISAPYLIGREVFGSEQLGANGGLIASGFANAGLIGVFIYSSLTGIVIGLLNSFGKFLGHEFVAALSFPIILIIVTSTDFATAVLTHGLFFLVLLLHLVPHKR